MGISELPMWNILGVQFHLFLVVPCFHPQFSLASHWVSYSHISKMPLPTLSHKVIPCIISDSSDCMVTPLLPASHAQRIHMCNMHTSLFFLFHLYLMLQTNQLHLGLVIQLVFPPHWFSLLVELLFCPQLFPLSFLVAFLGVLHWFNLRIHNTTAHLMFDVPQFH